MNNLRHWLALSLLLSGCVLAQENVAPAAPLLRSPADLEQLVAPIALYPDALIALILPAATTPADIVLAARHLRDYPGDRSQIEHRSWDESVKSLTSYPEIISWMDENLDWVKQVGQAFAIQPADVMQAVQRLRVRARANGTLVDTPQQQILADAGAIRIVPAQPDIIYVPRYEPEIVFVDRPVYPYAYGRPFFTFGVGVAVGSWLASDCDWRRNTIWVGNRHRPWVGHDWHRPVVSYVPSAPNRSAASLVRQWQPPAVRPGFSSAPFTSRPVPVVRPTVIGAPMRRNHDDDNARSFTPSYRSSPSTTASDVGLVPLLSARPSGNRSRATTSVVAPPLPSLPPLASTVPPLSPPPPVRSPQSPTYSRGHRTGVATAPSPSVGLAPSAAPVAANTPSHRASPRYAPPPPSPAVSAPAPAPSVAPAPAPTSTPPPASSPPARGDRRSGRRSDNS